MNNKLRYFLLFLLIAAIALVIYFAESKKPKQIESGERQELALTNRLAEKDKKNKYSPAIEIVRPFGFINTDEFALKDLIGKKVILVDFWTYSCINCQRTFPYLNAWHEKYKDMGLEIVGIHTPEFEFEKDYDNVVAATKKYGIKHKVVQDNDYATWKAYNNRYWPAKYLIDIDGYIVYRHFGEGMYEETENKIIELLNERRERLGESEVVAEATRPKDAKEVDFHEIYTPETYLGYSRIKAIANLPSTKCLGGICDYKKTGALPMNAYELDGGWNIQPEYAESTEDTGSIIIHFSANQVNLVAGGDKQIVAEIYLDGKLISNDFSGNDVSDGKLIFGEYDLYNLVDLKGDYGSHTLEIKALEPGLKAFAFTFG